MEYYIDNAITLESTLDFKSGINYDFLMYGDCYFIKNNGKPDNKISQKTSELRVSNAIFNKLKEYPGSKLFNSMQFGGIEFDHIISTSKGRVFLIELHGF